MTLIHRIQGSPQLTRSVIVAVIVGLMTFGFGTVWSRSAKAATIDTAESFGPALTDWTQTLSFAKFDPSLGTLNSVTVIADATADGSIELENRTNGATTILGTLAAEISLSPLGPNSELLVTPSAERSFDAGTYDGAIDFAGASGTGYFNVLTDVAHEEATFTGADLDYFIASAGDTAFDVNAVATAKSMATAQGNLVSRFVTNASVSVEVVYDYTGYQLGDRVWLDADGDGLQTPGEIGVAGVPVTLLDEFGDEVATTETDAQGEYLFDDVDGGDYTVVFEPTMAVTTADVGADDTVDSDGVEVAVTLDRDRLDIDLGLVPTSIGDFVWLDENGNGLQDGGEPGVPGVDVKLLQNGVELAATQTDDSGIYGFSSLLPGVYTVVFEPSAEYDFTQGNVGQDDSLDSDGASIDVLVGVSPREDIDAGLILLDVATTTTTVPAAATTTTTGPAAETTTTTGPDGGTTTTTAPAAETTTTTGPAAETTTTTGPDGGTTTTTGPDGGTTTTTAPAAETTTTTGPDVATTTTTGPDGGTTTTTAVATTTTAAADTTTTSVADTTTTTTPADVTSTTQPVTTTTRPKNPPLAFTGSGSDTLTIFGLSALLAGLTLVIAFQTQVSGRKKR